MVVDADETWAWTWAWVVNASGLRNAFTHCPPHEEIRQRHARDEEHMPPGRDRIEESAGAHVRGQLDAEREQRQHDAEYQQRQPHRLPTGIRRFRVSNGFG